jgi:toxin CcdB
MACFDLHTLRDGSGLAVDVQSDLLDEFGTRVVVPLIDRVHAPEAPRRLTPIFDIDGQAMILATPLLSAVPTGMLGPSAGSLAAYQDQIRAALDMLFLGF